MAKTLYDLLQTQYGVKGRAKMSQISVDFNLPATLICSNNPNRVGFALSNISSHSIYISFERAMSINDGILIGANGGNISFMWLEDFDVVGWNVYGVASIAASLINVIEIILMP